MTLSGVQGMGSADENDRRSTAPDNRVAYWAYAGRRVPAAIALFGLFDSDDEYDAQPNTHD